MQELRGKVAVVTGAASGIGRAMAERFAAEGMKVVLADIEAGALSSAEAEMRAGGATALAVKTDVSRAADVEALASKTLDAFGERFLGLQLVGRDYGVRGERGRVGDVVVAAGRGEQRDGQRGDDSSTVHDARLLRSSPLPNRHPKSLSRRLRYVVAVARRFRPTLILASIFFLGLPWLYTVLYPAVSYPTYEMGAILAGCRAVPVPPTDSIFAVIAEELGLAGVIGTVTLYALLVWRGLRIAQRSPDMLGSLLASGLTLWIAIEAVINMLVMVGLMPFAGNALPFISYGGSNLVSTFLAIGILMSVSRHIQPQTETEEWRNLGASLDLRRRNRRRSVSRTSRP